MLHVEEIRPLRMPDAPHHRLITIGIVVGIHIVVISAFLMGLRPPFFAPEKPDVCVTCIPNLTPTTRPLPQAPAPNLKNPTLPTVQPPNFDVAKDIPQGPITVVRGDPVGPVNPPLLDFGPRAITGTHTIPDYPQFDSRVGHEGTVTLRLAINERGVVTDAVVEHSSGYDGLDQAAVNWVKAHWRYYPATHAGDAIASSADVTVTFRLTNRS